MRPSPLLPALFHRACSDSGSIGHGPLAPDSALRNAAVEGPYRPLSCRSSCCRLAWSCSRCRSCSRSASSSAASLLTSITFWSIRVNFLLAASSPSFSRRSFSAFFSASMRSMRCSPSWMRRWAASITLRKSSLSFSVPLRSQSMYLVLASASACFPASFPPVASASTHASAPTLSTGVTGRSSRNLNFLIPDTMRRRYWDMCRCPGLWW
mmetsp:Transcript_7165/g.15311  ORF Transcript_7165/g.15311 Transcript_7165/m.15311 type:complete len:210 (-) Transcript_7165:436-1065(-)